MSSSEHFLKIGELVARYQITRDGINKLVRRGVFPRGIKIGRAHRWALSELTAWEQAQAAKAAAV